MEEVESIDVQTGVIGCNSSDDGEVECATSSRTVQDDVIDKDLEDFLGDMENELDQLIMESKANPSVPKIPFAVWYENYKSRKKQSFLASDGWELYTSPDGYPYYYNSITEESEWAPYEDETREEGASTNKSIKPGGLLVGLQDLSPSPQKRPVTTITHITPGRDYDETEGPGNSLLDGLHDVAPSPLRYPVDTVKGLALVPPSNTDPPANHETTPHTTLLDMAKQSLFSFGGMNWRADNRKSQGRFTLEQIAGQVNGLDEHSIPPYCDESTTPPQPTTTTAATAAQKASSYGLSLYSAALSGWLGRPNTPGDDSTVREGGAERGGDASREALRQQLYAELKSLPGSVEIMVPPRSSTKIPFLVPKGKELIWKMQVKEYDMGFAVRLRQQGEGGAVESDLLPMEKISCDEVVSEGCCAENITRSFIFVFDNSYSKLRSKTCVYNIKVINAEGEDSVTGGMPSFLSPGTPIAISSSYPVIQDRAETSAVQSGESDDDSSCEYSSAVSGGDEVRGSMKQPVAREGSDEDRLSAGRRIVVDGRGFSVDLVPLSSSSRAVAAPISPDQVEEDYVDMPPSISSAVP